MFPDWFLFYKAGRAVQAGLSPYTDPSFYNPIQVAWLLSLTTWIPFQVWVWLMIAATSIGLIVFACKGATWYALSAPFIFGLYTGMLDGLLLLPARFGGLGLALLTLKPQLAAIYAPFKLLEWKRSGNTRQIWLFLIGALLLWAWPTLVDPHWIGEWLQVVPSLESRMHGATFAGYIVLFDQPLVFLGLFAVVYALVLWTRSGAFYLVAAFSPAFSPVDWMIAAPYATWRFAALSWLLAFAGIGGDTFRHGAGSQAFFLLGILIWIERDLGAKGTRRRELTHASARVDPEKNNGQKPH